MDILERIMEFSSDEDTRFHVTMRMSKLLVTLEDLDRAEHVLRRMESLTRKTAYHKPALIAARIQILLDRGDMTSARELFEEATLEFPGDDRISRFRKIIESSKEEGQ